MRWILLLVCASALVSAAAAAQDGSALEQELSNLYVGQTFDNHQPYLNREVWYDHDGNTTENPTPVCTNLYGKLQVTRVAVRDDQIMVQATRSGRRPAMRGGQQVWPSYASRDIVLRYKADGQPWTADAFDRAFQNSLHQRAKFVGLPPGTTTPPAGSDPRIIFFFNGTPVYRAGQGVTPPKNQNWIDPEYTESARRARAGGQVLLRFIVNEDGSVTDMTSAMPPLGFGLDEKAIHAAQRWQFTPGALDGQPVKVEVHAETSFCLY